jgi:DNA-directed RNA polymerase subunit RPC12/RpoP
MQKLITAYVYSAGSLLLALATALFLANLSMPPDFIPVRDPLLGLSQSAFFWVLGGALLITALFCLFGRQTGLSLSVVLWLSLNLMIYRLALPFTGVKGGLTGYLGSLAGAFGISTGTMIALLTMTVIYLFLGGCVAGLLVRAVERRELASPRAKLICAHCGGHVEFSLLNLGRKIPCPHCRKIITLRKPENLKMSCFFCQEHIEFPAHAIGEKMPCPHCSMDITLKEPA